MKKRLISILCAAAMATSLFAGATVVSAAENKEAKDITIGVSFGQNVHPFFVAMQKGIEQACTDLGVENCNILAADSSLETQVSQIENLVTKGCDVLLLNPYDSDGVVNAVQAATDKGVGVFTMDVDCEGSTSFVASDNYKVGEMLADAVIEQLDGKGKIAIIDGITVTSMKITYVYHDQTYNLDNGTQVDTLLSNDSGVAFIVKTKEGTIYHAGDLNDWYWDGEPKADNQRLTSAYRAEIRKIKGMHFDAAFVPLDPRQGDHYADGILYFLKNVDCNVIFPMHYWNDANVIKRFITEYPQYKSRIKNTECTKGEEL